jgi:two-component system response regulator MprA
MGKILVIASKEQDRSAMNKFLNGIGFDKIIMAQNGEEGIKQVYLEHPDLVVIDSSLPDIDSFETCHRIKDTSTYSAPIVVMMTDFIDVKSAEKALEAGVDDLCVKAFDFSVLTDTVKKFMRVLLRRGKKEERISHMELHHLALR